MTIAERQLPLYQTPPHSCSYLEGMLSSNVFVDPDVGMDPTAYGALLTQGFRRSGSHVYRPWCEGCNACVPARVPVATFRPNRSQRRTLRNNADIEVIDRPAQFDPEHFALYKRYTAERHGDGEMAAANAADYRDFLIAPWSDTRFVEMRLDGRLVALAVTDRVPEALSAVYTFFDPDLPRRSLGVLGVLTQLELTRRAGLPHLYLGYWIADCRKMAYKADYRPLEVLQAGRWRTLETGAGED